MDYVNGNQKILDKWLQKFIKNGGDENKFAPDGIMYRGKMEQYENGNWRFVQDSSKENRLWSECPKRILFILKEQNSWGGDAWDVREESYHKPNTEEDDYQSRKMVFHKNLLSILYGFAKTTTKKMVEYETINLSDALKLSDEIPYAKINVKKEAGGGSSNNWSVETEMDKYAPFLKKQIININSDVIICCNYMKSYPTYKSYIVRFLKENVYPKMEMISDNLWFDEEHNKLVLSTWHLSYGWAGGLTYYNKVMIPYFEFLRTHPDFSKNHRI